MASQTKKGEALPAISDVLGTLKDRQKRLDEADSRLSELIKELENELVKYVSVRISTDITDLDRSSFITDLVFGKHDGKWQLVVEVDFPDATSDKTPLLSCSRETRLRMVTDGHIEALIRGAASQLDKQLAVREKAIDQAHKLVIDLGGLPF